MREQIENDNQRLSEETKAAQLTLIKRYFSGEQIVYIA